MLARVTQRWKHLHGLFGMIIVGLALLLGAATTASAAFVSLQPADNFTIAPEGSLPYANVPLRATWNGPVGLTADAPCSVAAASISASPTTEGGLIPDRNRSTSASLSEIARSASPGLFGGTASFLYPGTYYWQAQVAVYQVVPGSVPPAVACLGLKVGSAVGSFTVLSKTPPASSSPVVAAAPAKAPCARPRRRLASATSSVALARRAVRRARFGSTASQQRAAKALQKALVAQRSAQKALTACRRR